MKDLLAVSPEVSHALAAGVPVVALETTVVTHGLPHPHGIEIAAEIESAVRAHGATPATIGIIDGRIRVGLSATETSQLGRAPEVAKVNLGNLAAQLTSGRPGSTTVAATLLIAHLAGIEVLATGGIGGVHRDASDTGDVSSDLTALGRFPVAVVCAGAKAVLDLARTLEALETLGVAVFGFGTDRFPAFYRRDSGLPVDGSFPTIEALAAAVRAHLGLGLGTGVVVANPVPREHELGQQLYETALAGALADASQAGVRGRELTPFLLERLRERTGGASVSANRALLLHNARMAAALAAGLAHNRHR